MSEDILEKVTKRVEEYLEGTHGDEFEKFEDGRYIIMVGTTVVQLLVRAWHKDDAIVDCFSFLVYEATITEDLMRYLLNENANIHFGAFSLTFDDTIKFSHSIAGVNMDQNEFEATIKTVAQIADHYDVEIIKMAGGKTAQEALKEGLL